MVEPGVTDPLPPPTVGEVLAMIVLAPVAAIAVSDTPGRPESEESRRIRKQKAMQAKFDSMYSRSEE